MRERSAHLGHSSIGVPVAFVALQSGCEWNYNSPHMGMSRSKQMLIRWETAAT